MNTVQQKTPLYRIKAKWHTVLDECNEPRIFGSKADAQTWIDEQDARIFEATGDVAGRPEYRILTQQKQ